MAWEMGGKQVLTDSQDTPTRIWIADDKPIIVGRKNESRAIIASSKEVHRDNRH